MKKLLVVTLSMSCMFVLAACGNKEPEPTPPSIEAEGEAHLAIDAVENYVYEEEIAGDLETEVDLGRDTAGEVALANENDDVVLIVDENSVEVE